MTRKNEPNQNTTVNSQLLAEKLKTLYRSQNTLPKLIEDKKIKAQSLDEYYVKLQILLSEDDEAGKAALRDKVVGEKKSIEIENIFKAVDIERKIEELLCKILENKDDSEKIKRIIDIINNNREENNQINLVHQELGNKNNIEEIKNIIDSINKIQADIGKILLLGGAGVGKTTLLHNISYKWGKWELWNDKFDYVFRVKLKELLNVEWLGDYTAEQRQDKLSCFIHYCLIHSDSAKKFTKQEKAQLLKDILSIEKKQRDKVLLLLDGYDEVAHLNMSNRNDFQDIMDEISEYKNVIMSSRPNALIEGMSNGFERKVENTGWDKEGIDKYVDKNFENDKVLGMQLKSFLAVNSQIKEICEVPINTALVYLVWGDPKTRERLQKDTNEDFNISQLYQEVVIWLGKKYFQKFENKEVVNITDQQIFLKEEVQFLQKVAYESLVKTGKLVESDIIKKNLGKLDIGEINKFGLLKAEGTGRELINFNHQFIHLTFQEYLVARYLKDQLANNDAKSKAASFIGEHRNEPKYLMTLKFLAGIVANEDKDQNLAIRFWEAVTCNVDGTLELGLETKVTLLMHILVQSKVSGKLDSGIPNLKQIQQLIDDTILKDITNWEQQIIESGYLSEAIIATITSILDNQNKNIKNQDIETQKFKTSIEIITSLSNRNELSGKTKVYEQLVDLLQIKDQILQKLVLEKLIQIIDGTIEQKILQVSLKTLLPLLKSYSLNELAARSLPEVVKVMPSLAAEVYKELVELLKSSNYDAQPAAVKSLTEVVKAMPAEESYKELVELLKGSNDYVNIKEATASSLSEVIKTVPAEVVVSLLEVIKTMPAEAVFKEISELLKSSNDNVKSVAVRGLLVVVKAKPSLANEAYKELTKILKSSNDDVWYEIAISLSEIVKIEPKLAEKVFKAEILETQLNNSNSPVIVLNLLKVVNIIPKTEQIFKALQKLLTSSNYNVKSEVFRSLVEVVKSMPVVTEG